MKKMSLYKFIHIPLLKNDVHLKQKHDKQQKKKEIKQSPKFIKKIKKSCLVKKKKKQTNKALLRPRPRKSKEKR